MKLSHSRPYHKNDNRFVKKKNGFLVRSLLGYERLDTAAQALLITGYIKRFGFTSTSSNL